MSLPNMTGASAPRAWHARFLRRLCAAAVCLALCMVLPFLTGQIPRVGNLLSPMHLPVLLCGALCGGGFGLAVGICAPVLRFLLVGAPTLLPRGICMMAELGVYGLCMGFFSRILYQKKRMVYIFLPVAMIAGRIAGGIAKWFFWFFGVLPEYGWKAFLSGYFLGTLPGAIVQMLLIPPAFFALCRVWERESAHDVARED